MFRPRRQFGGGRQTPGLAIWLLVAQILQVGVNNIPPVTLALIGSQVAIYLRLIPLPFGGINDVCVGSLEVWYKEDWKRLVLASFYHTSEWHLYFNMVSLIWKGRNLERRYGSKYFLYIVAVFSILINAMIVGIGVLASEVLDNHSYIRQCAVGFSGVLFALKVIANHLSPPGTEYLMGFLPIPSRIACWAELVLIHILVPNSSFIGHLSGILVGLLYIKGPLKYAMNLVIPSTPSYTYTAAPSGFSAQAANNRQRFRPGRVYNNIPAQQQTPDVNNYSGGMSEDEQLARAVELSLRESNSRPTEASASPNDESQNSDVPYPLHPPHNMPMPDAPPYPGPPGPRNNESNPRDRTSSQLYPDLQDIQNPVRGNQSPGMDEIRRRRLQRFS